MLWYACMLRCCRYGLTASMGYCSGVLCGSVLCGAALLPLLPTA